ncbi:hypothetical protein BH11MYX3_BH11MYX3_14840 [soil metagenome]
MTDIPDRNLRLALTDEVERRRIDNYWWIGPTLGAAFEQRSGVAWASLSERDDDEPLPLVETLVLEVPLDAERLGTITTLTLDGDRDVYAWGYPYWWDLEPGHYEIRDLRGIEGCTRLVFLSLGQGLVGNCSLAPLRGLPALEHLVLCTTGSFTELDSLLELPALKRIEVFNLGSTPEPVWTRIVDELRTRGVATS